ncbi:MAG: RNA polymerase sigma-70 factor [Bacteroidetes bacterium]|nr:RNA polymerase sigma-70 factor [Bacteroidota bacterium]
MALDSPYNEQELLSRLAANDVKAYEELYNHHYLSIFRFARKFVDMRAAAEDIVTDVFVRLWTRRADFSSFSGVRAFLFTATRNACLNYLRDEKKHSDIHHQLSALMPSETEDDAFRQQVAEEVFRYIQEEIAKLSPKMKAILQLHLQGVKNDEIARQLDISEKTVRNLKAEAIKLLRIAMLNNEFLLLLLWLYHDQLPAAQNF